MNHRRDLVLVPFVIGAVYAWMVCDALHTLGLTLGQRFWPGPPIDYP